MWRLSCRAQSASAGVLGSGEAKADMTSSEGSEMDIGKRLERKNAMRKRWMERVDHGEWPVPSKKDAPANGTADLDKSSPSPAAAPVVAASSA